ncbi:hypothetical protein SynROS8604_00278 [Synechococcus sp. ROS8604]|nr:hypothetical protein SynROS8604_00278 [Synechococcus sp. ROS8604]
MNHATELLQLCINFDCMRVSNHPRSHLSPMQSQKKGGGRTPSALARQRHEIDTLACLHLPGVNYFSS